MTHSRHPKVYPVAENLNDFVLGFYKLPTNRPDQKISRLDAVRLVTIPPHLRNNAYLPEDSGIVLFECCASEPNFWSEEAYDEESI